MSEAAILASLILAGHLAAIAWIDCQRFVIPNAWNLSLALCGLIVSYTPVGIGLAGALSAGAITIFSFLLISLLYSQIRGRSGLGMGDIKFLGASALWVGLAGIPWVVLIGSISGLTWVLVLHLLGTKMETDAKLAYGPHLSVGVMAVWLLGDLIIAQV